MTYRRGFKRVKDWAALFSEQLTYLARFDAKTATEMLSQSMRNGWQGIFELKGNQNGNGHHKNTSLNPAADRRNAGTIKSVTDYGEAGRRKLAKQEAARLAAEQAENGNAPPQTIGRNAATDSTATGHS